MDILNKPLKIYHVEKPSSNNNPDERNRNKQDKRKITDKSENLSKCSSKESLGSNI